MSTKALIGILLAGTTGILIFLFVHLSGSSNKITIGTAHAQACNRNADDCLPDVKYIDVGKAYTTDSLAGKIVVVNFWATWCSPVPEGDPDLSKMYEAYKAKGVIMLGVMTDNPPDSDLLNFQSDYEMTYPVVRGNSDIIASFKYPQALPTTFVFDRSGRRVSRHDRRRDPARRSLGDAHDELVAQK